MQLNLYRRGNYLYLRNLISHGFLKAGVTIEARAYVDFEADTGFHHYAIDCATYRLVEV